MKKLSIILTTIFAVFFFLNEKMNAQTINISKVSKYEISVSGNVPGNQTSKEFREWQNGEDGQGLFLGVTIIADGKEYDFPGYVVSRVTRRYKETFYISTLGRIPQGEIFQAKEITCVVALWQLKIWEDACQRGSNRTSCKYCKENKFHLEKRVAREVSR